MISIDFLNGEIAGLENLRYQQKRELYLELTEVIADNLTVTSLSKDAAKDIEAVITTHCGFENVSVDLQKNAFNAYAHGTAFFTPSNILRNRGIEDYVSEKECLAFKALKKLEKEVLLGWVDYNTGKVCGDFAKVRCVITLDTELDNILPEEPVGITYAQAFALIIMHEVGHFFNMCASVGDVAADDYISKMAVATIANESDPKKKIAVLKHAGELIELNVTSKELEDVITAGDSLAIQSFMMTKVMLRDRNRAQSLGVSDMSSEVLADAYAVRMGGSIDVAKMTDTFRRYNSSANRQNAIVNVMHQIVKNMAASAGAGGAVLIFELVGILRTVVNFSSNNITLGGYNTPERRTTDIIKQVIVLIREDKLSSNAEKMATIKAIDELRKIPKCDFLFDASSVNPISTFTNRLLGNLLTGGQWSKTEYAHYTASIASHEVNLLEHKFNALLV